jgi:hypothetical protein
LIIEVQLAHLLNFVKNPFLRPGVFDVMSIVEDMFNDFLIILETFVCEGDLNTHVGRAPEIVTWGTP